MIPKFLCPFFWDYDCEKLDLVRHKNLIIKQVLNVGTEEATKWLFEKYYKEEIIAVLKDLKRGDLDKKSEHYWKTLLGV